MPKKRKTRKQKEKAADRRATQYASILDTISDSHNDDVDNVKPKKQLFMSTEKAEVNIVDEEKWIKKDLIRIFVLVLFFALILIILAVIENRNGYLDQISNNLMQLLVK